MSRPEIAMRYPLLYPSDRPRTLLRKVALFRNDGKRMSLTAARHRLIEQVGAMTRLGKPWRVLNMVLSTNIRFTASGARDRNVSRHDPDDTGVAFYFDLDGKPHVLACDRWDTVADNVAAIAAHVDALRGQERWGVADLRQAFAGHVALPAPEQWWQVLEVGQFATADQINAAWRSAIAGAHPDRGGSEAAAARINAARDAGIAARS